MKKEEIFGSFKNNNTNLLVKYIKEMDKELQKYYQFGTPFFKYETNFSFSKNLVDKTLNYHPIEISDLYKSLAEYFQNLPNWINPGTMINVIPPVNLIALAASTIANMYNPNFAQDSYSGLLLMCELEVSKYLSDLIGWNWHNSHGVFTFGGTGTNLYATKIALTKADPNSLHNGFKKEYFLLTSDLGHPCHYEICDWLGIGRNNCFQIKSINGQMDLVEAERIIEENIHKGKIFLGFNLTAGSTNELYVDPVKQINDLAIKVQKKYKLDYKPHIHADAVLGWVYLFFQKYDFHNNPLNIKTECLSKIHSLTNKIDSLKYADSIGVDFHKTGFCPYVSSMVLFKSKNDYYRLSSNDNVDEYIFGSYNPYHTTLELTRPSSGAISAWCTLKSLGIEGFQKIVSDIFTATEYFRSQIKKNSKFCLINPDTEGLATLFIIKPSEYINLNLDEILKLSNQDLELIKRYNNNFSKFILSEAIKNKISFIITSSRSYIIPNTDIKIGALKAYPMSVYLTEQEIDKIIIQLNKILDEYEGNSNIDIEISDNMVYR